MEMIYEIADKLEGSDVINFIKVNKYIYRIRYDEDYWNRRSDKIKLKKSGSKYITKHYKLVKDPIYIYYSKYMIKNNERYIKYINLWNLLLRILNEGDKIIKIYFNKQYREEILMVPYKNPLIMKNYDNYIDALVKNFKLKHCKSCNRIKRFVFLANHKCPECYYKNKL
jgi:hypothetical protein